MGSFIEQEHQVVFNIQAASFRHFHHRIDPGAGARPGGSIAEQPVFPTNGDGTDGVFIEVVGEAALAILKVGIQIQSVVERMIEVFEAYKSQVDNRIDMNRERMDTTGLNGNSRTLPLVSVIIPVYNVAPFLREALESVVNQSYDKLEIIVVDDGSTDGSGAICEEYGRDARVRVIHKSNCGLSNARNIGLEYCTGQYIAFLDSDDAYHIDFCRLMLETATTTQADVVVCKYMVFHTLREMKRQRTRIVRPSLESGDYSRKDALRALAEGRFGFNVWNRLYKRRLWEKVRFPDGLNFEDVDTTCRILDICASVYVLDRPLYLYRVRRGSITNTASWKNYFDSEIAHANLKLFIDAHTPEVFGREHARKVCQARFGGMVTQCVEFKNSADKALFEVLRERIIGQDGRSMILKCNFRTKTWYWIILFCPWLLRIVYPAYRVARRLIWRVTGL